VANEQNLTPWRPGQSGNPAGKPKGSKHLSTWIRDLLDDEQFTVRLSSGDSFIGAPVKAIVTALITQAIEGDMKAFDLLAKYGYGTKIDVTSGNERLPQPLLSGLSVQPIETVDRPEVSRHSSSA
jgi:hypothetical protein